MPSNVFVETNGALLGCKNTDDFAFIYDKFKDTMTDKQISYGFYFISMHQLDKNEGFWKVIYPMVKK